MDVTLVHVRVKSDKVEAFIKATRANHEASVSEPGNLRFDVLQSSADPTRFVLYEAYASGEQARAHKTTTHYLAWRETVADWMAEPREGVPYQGLFPETGSA
jgi:autoinducer 2-degrading protein